MAQTTSNKTQWAVVRWNVTGRYRLVDALHIYKREADAKRKADKLNEKQPLQNWVVRPTDYMQF